MKRPRLFSFAIVMFLAGARAPAQEASEFKQQASLFALQCMKCHTIGGGDRVGPDLKGITARRDRDWGVQFIQRPSAFLDTDPVAIELLGQYSDVRMPDLGITPDQAEGLMDYIVAFGLGELPGMEVRLPPPPKISTRVIGPDEGRGVSAAGVLAALALLAGAAFLQAHRRPRLAQAAFVLVLGAGYWSLGGRANYHAVGNDQGFAPEQPIAFSHAQHAGDLDISCLYCHQGAEKGPVAGIPAVSTCMNCHAVVRQNADQTEPSAEIAKIVAAWESRETENPRSIEWNRVHHMADFVSFDHRAHVTNGITCQECHGPVETMERLRQASDLSMGWCVSCHRLQGKEAEPHWKNSGATRDCAACHT